MSNIRGRLLDLAYEIAVEDESLAAHLRDVYRDSRDDAIENVERFDLSGEGSGEFVITHGGETVVSSPAPAHALGMLHWHVNRRTMATSTRPVLVHAGTLEVAGRGVLVVGASGAGKSTATASLALAGLGYLTDDITAVLSGGRVTGAAKPISLRGPSIELLGLSGEQLQSPPPDYAADGVAQHFLAASSLGASIASSADPGMIVFLSSELPAGSAREFGRSGSLARLTEYAFDVERMPNEGFEALAELVGASTCWEWGRSTAAELAEFVTKTIDQ